MPAAGAPVDARESPRISRKPGIADMCDATAQKLGSTWSVAAITAACAAYFAGGADLGMDRRMAIMDAIMVRNRVLAAGMARLWRRVWPLPTING